MSGNNCDDAFQQLQDLQKEKQRLQDDNAAMERVLKAAGFQRQPLPGGGSVFVPGRGGAPYELDKADLRQSQLELAATMRSAEVDDIVDRGFDTLARPVGSEGRFQNYDRLLREVDVKTVEDYARLAEALGITLERIAPEDFAFITQKYGRERLTELISGYYKGLGAKDPDLLAQAAAKTAPAINAVENKLWLRFWADRTKRSYLDTLEQIRDYMEAIPGQRPPDELLQESFRQYKLALVMERHNNLVTRRHAQALRSQQENILDLEQFRLDLGDEGEEGIRGAIGLTAKDVSVDEQFGRVVDAIDNNDAEQLDLIIDATDLDGLDPKSQLGKDWFNTHMKMANALIKDSQLASVNTQFLNLGSNVVMGVYSPIQQTMYNGVRLTPVGTKMTRKELLEAARITAEAHNYAMTTLRATWRRDVSRVFNTGVSHYSGNLDTYGMRLLTNQQELQDMQSIIDTPYMSGANKFTQLLNPHNMGLFTNKLQAAARILMLTKPGGTSNTGMSRIEAAYTALGFGRGQNARRLRVNAIDLYTPWKPALRTMAGVDEVFGKYHYLFKLKADLEVKARMEGAQLGLFTDKDRAEWVQARLDEAIYRATPTESDIKAYRKANGLKGSDITDAEIVAKLTEQELAGAPTLATPESVEALRYSSEMRFQDSPSGNPGQMLDVAAMGARKTWWVDRALLPYWRSPFMGMLFDHRLATFGIIDTAKMIGGQNPSPELVARAKAGWVMSGSLLAIFGMLDAAGQIGGGTDPNPDRRNTLFGVRLAGWPVLNTLFLWKDLLDTGKASLSNEYDGQELGLAWMKVMTAQIMRQAGLAQIQMLVDAMLDGNRTGGEKMRQFAGFMGSGQLPFIGFERNVERLVGMDRNSFYRDEPNTAQQQYMLGQDDPIAQLEQSLRNLLTDTMPLASGLLGAKRKLTDHLGTPIGHFNGINLAKALPFFPAVWPKGKINEVVYAELDTQDMLDPPPPLLLRKLEGIAMSDDLQFEYNEIHGSMKGDPKLPPSARLKLAGKSAELRFRLPVDVVTQAGFRVKEDGGVSLPLGQILDALTKNRTKKEALYALFSSQWYQRIEDNPDLSSRPPGGLPAPLRRQRTAQVLIRRLTDYYDLLTQDELERRAAKGTSAAAKDWSNAKTQLMINTFNQSLRRVGAAAEALSDPTVPAQ